MLLEWARDVSVGGVFCFSLTGCDKKRLLNIPGLLRPADTDARFLKQRSSMFSAETAWVDSAECFSSDVLFYSIVLPSGKQVLSQEKAPVVAHLQLIYYVESGLASIILWTPPASGPLSTKEVIEFASAVRGASDIAVGEKTAIIECQCGDVSYQGISILDLVIIFLNNAIARAESCRRHFWLDVRLSHPMVYIGMAEGCEVASDIAEMYGQEVAGIANLWIHDYRWMKDASVKHIMEEDMHPLNYGITVISSICTIEAHSRNTQEIAKEEDQSLAEHHEQERVYLGLLAELAMAHYFALRTFDEQVEKVLKTLKTTPSYWFALLIQAIRVTAIKRTLLLSMSKLRNIYFVRKSYSRRVLNVFQREFAADVLETSLEKKLSAVDSIIGSVFGMYTAIFALVFSISATIVALLQLVK